MAVTTLATLLAAPFTIRLLGVESYGVWALVNVIIGQIGLVDFGMGNASTRFGAKAYAEADAEAESAAIWTALGFSSLATLLPALLVAAFAGPILLDLL